MVYSYSTHVGSKLLVEASCLVILFSVCYCLIYTKTIINITDRLSTAIRKVLDNLLVIFKFPQLNIIKNDKP